MTRNFTLTTDFSKTKKSGGQSILRPKLLDDKIETKNVYSSANGIKATKEKIAKRQAENHLLNHKGIAIVCKPNEGTLPPNSTLVVNVSIYNEISGNFTDTQISEVKGQDPVSFPVKLFIKGSPLIIPINQVGLDIKSQPCLLNLGGMQLNANPIVKTFKLENIGTSDQDVDLRIYDVDNQDPNRDQFNIKIQPPQPGTKDMCFVNWQAIAPPEALEGPFQVNPSSCIISSKTIKSFEVSYYLNEEKKCNSVITATPRIHKSINSVDKVDFDLGTLAVKIKAETFLPKVDLHKQPNLHGLIVYKFHKWSVEKSPKQERTILLINRLPSHLYFDLSLEGPFSFQSATKSQVDHKNENGNDNSKSQIQNSADENSNSVKNYNSKKDTLGGKEIHDMDLIEAANLGQLISFDGYNSKDLISYKKVIRTKYENNKI